MLYTQALQVKLCFGGENVNVIFIYYFVCPDYPTSIHTVARKATAVTFKAVGPECIRKAQKNLELLPPKCS